MQSEYVPAIECPFCGGQHQVGIARNGRPYASCGEWLNRIFGNSPASLALFQNGGRTRANYSNPRIRKTNPAPKQGEMSRFLSGDVPGKEKTGQCPNCGRPIVEDQPRCECGKILEWEITDTPQEGDQVW